MRTKINFPRAMKVDITGFTYRGSIGADAKKEIIDIYSIDARNNARVWVYHEGRVDEAIAVSVVANGKHNYGRAMVELHQRGIPTVRVA